MPRTSRWASIDPPPKSDSGYVKVEEVLYSTTINRSPQGVLLASEIARDYESADDPRSIVRKLIDAWREQWPTLILLVFLALVAVLCYVASTWSAVHLSQSARILGETARKVTAQHGNDAALERELILQLSKIQRRDDFSDVMLHLAIGCFVAIVVILMVEIYSSYRTRTEIAQYRDAVAREVWTALSGRLVPHQIVDEIHGILKADAIKKDVRYVLTFTRYAGLPEGLVVLQRKLSYTLVNLTGRRAVHPIQSIIDSIYPDLHCQEKGASVVLPRHLSFHLDGKPIALSQEAGTLHRNRHGQLRNLVYSVELGRTKNMAQVYVSSEEAVPISGSNSYIQMKPVTGLTVSVENKVEDMIGMIEVELNHPNFEEFTAGADGVYQYPGGVLPGQSITVFWGALRHPHSKDGMKTVEA